MKTIFTPEIAVDVQVLDNYTGEIIFTSEYTLGDIVNILPGQPCNAQYILECCVKQFNKDLEEFVREEDQKSVLLARACMKLLAEGIYTCTYDPKEGWIQISLTL